MKTFVVGERVVTSSGKKGTVQSLSSPPNNAIIQIDDGELETHNITTLSKEA